MADCLFCGIAADEVPATRVLETEAVLAFRDINPRAPTHVLGRRDLSWPRDERRTR